MTISLEFYYGLIFPGVLLATGAALYWLTRREEARKRKAAERDG